MLSEYYNSKFSLEYSRQYASEFEVLSFSTVMPIAEGQLKLEQDLIRKGINDDVVFFDTNLLETLVYSELYYFKIPDELHKLVLKQDYDLYLLCDVDIPWNNDGIRDLPENRDLHYNLFKRYLVNYNANFLELKGSAEEKLELAKQKINQLLINEL